jgi:hypothetical protein
MFSCLGMVAMMEITAFLKDPRGVEILFGERAPRHPVTIAAL